MATGRLFVRFRAGVRAAERAEALAAAGYEIERVPGWAPHTAWVRPRAPATNDDAGGGVGGVSVGVIGGGSDAGRAAASRDEEEDAADEPENRGDAAAQALARLADVEHVEREWLRQRAPR